MPNRDLELIVQTHHEEGIIDDMQQKRVPLYVATGMLKVTTTPVSGAIYVNGTYIGSGSKSIELDVGNYTVSFGDVSGYVTPSSRTARIYEDQTTTITGVYTVPELVASFDASPKSGTVPLPVTFSLSISGGVSPYSWVLDFKDGSSSATGTEASKTLIHTYNKSGTFVVTLTVTDALGASTLTESGIGVGLLELAWWQWGLLLGWAAIGGVGFALGRNVSGNDK
ncbi:hypothetical protein ES708_23301 [subsurface metagenome]